MDCRHVGTVDMWQRPLQPISRHYPKSTAHAPICIPSLKPIFSQYPIVHTMLYSTNLGSAPLLPMSSPYTITSTQVLSEYHLTCPMQSEYHPYWPCPVSPTLVQSEYRMFCPCTISTPSLLAMSCQYTIFPDHFQLKYHICYQYHHIFCTSLISSLPLLLRSRQSMYVD